MSNKKVFKELYSTKINKDRNYHSILTQLEKGNENKMKKILTYTLLPLCLILCVYVGISTLTKSTLKEDIIADIRVYAYSITDDKNVEEREIKEKIQLPLEKYNPAMSSVPGYPIKLELEDMEKVVISVKEGTIYDYDRKAGRVTSLGNEYQLTSDATLYFNVNDKTEIKIVGTNQKKEILEKNVVISMDSNYNYYATLK